MIVSKYKDTMFDLPDADNDTFYIGESEIKWVCEKDGTLDYVWGV